MRSFGNEFKNRVLKKGWAQKTAAAELGVDERTIRRWEKGQSKPSAQHIPILRKKLFDGNSNDLDRLLSLLKNERYSTMNFMDAAEHLGSYEIIDRARDKITEEWPVPAEPGEYGSDHNWNEMFDLSPESGGVVLYHDAEIVAYWSCLAVKDELYDCILRGENINSRICKDDIYTLMFSKIHKLYFVDLFMSRSHRNYSVRKLLLTDFINFIRGAAEEGIFFERIAANITGIDAKQQCLGLGFKKVINHQVHKYYDSQNNIVPAEIFELDISKDAHRLFSHDSDSKLTKLYSDAGIIIPEKDED